jgi:hypothetical protein
MTLQDEGFMEQPSTQTDLGPDLDNDGKPNDVHWPLPYDWQVDVDVSPRLDPAYLDMLRKAVAQINEIVGREFLQAPLVAEITYATKIEIGGSVPRRRSIFVHDDGGDAPDHGFTNFYADPYGNLNSAEVQLPLHPGDFNLFALTKHEMWHCMGLDHDQSTASLMYPYMQKTPQGLTPKDRELIQRVYGRK